jgi:pyridoxamine 5'-phosphate oxidase
MEIPWLEPFRSAAAREAGRPIILALATVDEAGDPQVRSVVCRRVDDQGTLWIASDARSAKHHEIASHRRVAAVAWFPAPREQFRFSGLVQILDHSSDSPDRANLWQSLSPETRATFLWPAPGAPRTASDDAFARASDDAAPAPSFEIGVLRPDVTEHLVLSTHPHRRRRWTFEHQWRVQEINP